MVYARLRNEHLQRRPPLRRRQRLVHGLRRPRLHASRSKPPVRGFRGRARHPGIPLDRGPARQRRLGRKPIVFRKRHLEDAADMNLAVELDFIQLVHVCFAALGGGVHVAVDATLGLVNHRGQQMIVHPGVNRTTLLPAHQVEAQRSDLGRRLPLEHRLPVHPRALEPREKHIRRERGPVAEVHVRVNLARRHGHPRHVVAAAVQVVGGEQVRVVQEVGVHPDIELAGREAADPVEIGYPVGRPRVGSDRYVGLAEVAQCVGVQVHEHHRARDERLPDLARAVAVPVLPDRVAQGAEDPLVVLDFAVSRGAGK
ncbi:MAG: hypothetical protein BWY59_00047 [Verrucomicrobia bacterium ADurb.Bin345]|nr:MAG: hypothetical protein BWY59_00047 [Verrucomicrobia bacterium ADurb.Bin345]